jgi:phage-related protein
MERLLADAQELSGVEYNIDNLGDVYAAIHVIQEDLGLTGVAADEAASTFSGSLGAMQASATNLMANLALGEDITPALAQLGVSVQNFLLDNLFPMVGNILSALPELLSGLSSTLIGMLNIVNNNPEEIVQLGIDIVTGLVTAIVEAAPYLIEAAFNLAFALGEALINTDWASIGSNLISTLKNSISLAAGEILGTDTSVVGTLTSGILSGVSSLITTGGELLMSVVSGLLSALPDLITTAGELIIEFSSAILEQLPTILENGVQLILSFVQGITQDSSLAEIGSSVVSVITQFAATILENLPTILEQGILLLGELCAGLIEAIPDLVLTVGELIVNIVDTLSEYDWLTLGKNVVQGIIDGLMGMIDSLVDAVQNLASAIWDEIVDFFDIGSPSKLAEWGGQMIDEGWAGGIEKNAGLVEDAIGDLNENVGAQLMVEPNYGEVNPTSVGGQGYTLDDLFTLLSQYLPALAENQNNIVLQGDAEGLFNVVRSQDKIYKRMNGESAFA